MILTRDKGSRMWGGGGTGGSGGGGGLDPSALAGYASMGWVEDNYVSKAFFNQLFEYQYNHRVLTKDGETVVSDVTTSMVAAPNEVVDLVSHTETDEETGYTIITTNTITGIKAKAGLWTNQYLSALGQNSGGGGGGGSTTLADLLDVALSNPSNGQVLMYNATTQKWYNGTVQSSGGSVTSITAGTGLSGGTITISGTIALSSETQTNIGYGVVAYGWGNHADAGYLTSSAIIDMATQTWVTNNFLGVTATAAAATKLATARELWGQSFDGTAAVTGTLSYVGDINSNTIGSINNFNKIELNAAANAGNGGAIYFHYNGMSGRASGYIINDADGLVSVLTSTGNIGLKVGTQTGDYIQIGDIRIVYDNTDNRNSLKVVKSDGTAANFYATGAVSALGSNNSGGGGGGGASTLADLTDVILTNPAGGDLLQFNGTHWVNLTVATVMSGYAKLQYPNDLVHSSNEITMVPSGYSGDLYFNYQTVGGANGAITNYNFCNGNHAYAAVRASGFVKNGSNDSYVLLGGGGHALISSLSVGNADTVDGYHADHFLNRLDWWQESETHDVDTLTSGIVFAYSIHNAPTTGTIATFSGTNNTYQFQIMCCYSTDYICFRGKNGDNNTWQAWRSFIHSGNIGSQSVNYATSAGSANYATSAGSAPASDVYSWAKQPTKLSYSFSELTSTPTTLVGYGITDAYISSGTIYLGSNSITPVTSLAGYATETWVQQRGYLTSVAFNDLTSHPTTIAGYGITDAKFGTAGADYVPITLGSTTKNVLTAHQSLSAYATQTWVTNNFLGINATAAAATKLATARELWGQSFDGTASVTGTLSYVGDINSNTNGNINNFNGIEMSYKAGSGHGGGIFFHWNGVTGYSSAYIYHDADNHINMFGHTAGFGVQVGSQNGDYLQIGAVRLVYDTSNNALKVIKSDGTAANLYATGGLSALGMSAGVSSIEAMTFGYLKVNDQLVFGNNQALMYKDDYLYIECSDTISVNTVEFDYSGNVYTNGSVRAARFYLDSNRYLYVSGGTLYYYNGSTSKQVAFTN